MPVWTARPTEVFPLVPVGQCHLHEGCSWTLWLTQSPCGYTDLCVLLLPQPVSEIITVQMSGEINQGLIQLKTKPTPCSRVLLSFGQSLVKASGSSFIWFIAQVVTLPCRREDRASPPHSSLYLHQFNMVIKLHCQALQLYRYNDKSHKLEISGLSAGIKHTSHP